MNRKDAKKGKGRKGEKGKSIPHSLILFASSAFFASFAVLPGFILQGGE